MMYLRCYVNKLYCHQEGIARDYHIELYDKYKYKNPYIKDINELITFKYVFPNWNERYLEQGVKPEEMIWRERPVIR